MAGGVVVGCVLQVLVQLPAVLKMLGRFSWAVPLRSHSLRLVLKNFIPVLIGRGVVQVIAFIDSIIASWLPTGAVAALGYAQTIYFLPISLFGMAISAAELPVMSSATGSDQEIKEFLRRKMTQAVGQMAFFVVPSAAAFILLGDTIVAVLYQSGEFRRADTVYVWAALAGLGVGLLATTVSRLLAAGFYALGDTATPLHCALVRTAFVAVTAYVLAIYGPQWVGVDDSWGVVGLTGATGISSWVELFLLRRASEKRIGRLTWDSRALAKIWFAAIAAALLGWTVKAWVQDLRPVAAAAIVVPVFGAAYLALTMISGVAQSREFLNRLGGLWRRASLGR